MYGCVGCWPNLVTPRKPLAHKAAHPPPIRAQPASLRTRTALRTAERLLCACSDTPEGLSALMHDSWQTEPSLRPTFKEVRPSPPLMWPGKASVGLLTVGA